MILIASVGDVVRHPVHLCVARMHREPRGERQEEDEKDGTHHGQGQQVKVELSGKVEGDNSDEYDERDSDDEVFE